jgi:D-tyrosyl-tRNA(Tyr) deacylase
MKVVLQRVRSASVSVNNQVVGEIRRGYLLLVGIAQGDTEEQVKRMAQQIIKARLFSDADGKMQSSIVDISGEILVVSQFTLLADFAKGNRPSFHQAARPEIAQPLCDYLVDQLTQTLGRKIPTGVFGADMQVELMNDGPVTIVFE